ncbi:MAG: DUF937 domain-containing protein [Methylobacteriaceae bacterium]|nr:DUF937 domain-containing protein [Methylobacteriaceae bacterium]
MFNINDIIQAAHGGAAIDNIAAQFGLSPDQARSAVDALVPALSKGLQNQASDPAALGNIVNAVAGEGPHKDAFATPEAAFSEPAVQQGASVAGQVFGSGQTLNDIIAHAAQVSGVSPQILQQLLPSLTAIVMGGLFHSMQNQGLGGILGQLANAASSGGLGNIFGQSGTGQPQGGLGGLVGGLIGGLFGGNRPAAVGDVPGGTPSPQMQAGLESLTKMFEPGVQVPDARNRALDDILGQPTSPGPG